MKIIIYFNLKKNNVINYFLLRLRNQIKISQLGVFFFLKIAKR